MTIHERQELKEMIEYEIGGQIPDNALFFDDLQIGGNDCIELMNRIAAKYEVDMAGYDPLNYHETEREIETAWFTDVRPNRLVKSFDFNHLIEVIDKKKWYEPNQAS